MKGKTFIMRMALFCMLFVFTCSLASAQGRVLKGNVKDEATKEAIIGANVIIEGTVNGTVTDVDGNFTLRNVPAKGVLKVSYIGYETRKIQFDSHTKDLNIVLKEDGEMLDEVVVVGYGV